MIVNKYTGDVHFTSVKEEQNMLRNIMNAFSIKKDKEMTKAWLLFRSEHYEDFLSLFFDIFTLNVIAYGGDYKLYQEKVLKNIDFMLKIDNASEQVLKLIVVAMQGMINNFKLTGDEDKKEGYETIMKHMQKLIQDKISYNFLFDKNVKIKFYA